MKNDKYLRLGLFVGGWISSSPICLAEDISRESLLATNVDYSIFSESERHFLASRTPVLKIPSTEIQPSLLRQDEPEITLREIELKKYDSESDDEFLERGNNLYSELLGRPEVFQEKARSISASRSRFRSGLLTPLTINQLDPELAKEVVSLEPSQLSKPVKLGNSIFILRREPIKLATKLDQ